MTSKDAVNLCFTRAMNDPFVRQIIASLSMHINPDVAYRTVEGLVRVGMLAGVDATRAAIGSEAKELSNQPRRD